MSRNIKESSIEEEIEIISKGGKSYECGTPLVNLKDEDRMSDDISENIVIAPSQQDTMSMVKGANL